MELQVTQENLSKAINTVARVANTRSTLPILSNILFQVVDNRLSISATNLDIAIKHRIGAKITNPGSLTIPARLTQDFVSNLPSGTILLEQKEHKLHISAGSYDSTINGVPADDFPVMPEITKGASWTIPAQTLKKGLQQTLLAASSDEARPVLTGLLVHTQEGQLFAAATDSYRLAEKSLGKNKQTINLLIPATALHDVLRIIGDYSEDITVTHDEQQVLFTIGDVDLVARLIEGRYPEYQRLIPQSFTTEATVDRAELINITKVSSLFARENAGSIALHVSEKEKQVSIQSIASQLGENTASCEGDITGSGDITLNSRYLLEGLQALEGSKVQILFNGKLEPVVLRNPENTDYTHLVMPLKS